MKTSEEMAQSVMHRARVHKIARKRKIINITAAFLCVCGIGLFAITASRNTEPKPDTTQLQLNTNPTPDTTPTQPNTLPTVSASDVIDDLPEARITLLHYLADGSRRVEVQKDANTPYRMQLRVRDLRGLTEDEAEKIVNEEMEYARKLVDEYHKPMEDNAWACYTGENGVVTSISAGRFLLKVDDPKMVESFQVSLSGDGQLWHIPAEYSTDVRNYFVDAATVERYSLYAGGINMIWVLSSENCNKLAQDPSIPLSTFGDTITVTATYKDGTQQTDVIDIQIEDSGEVFAIYRGEAEVFPAELYM